MTTPDGADVVDEAAENRFVIRDGGGTEAELLYRVHGDRLVLIHTAVPEEWGGHGIGGRLVRAALARARSERPDRRALVPLRPPWLREHPDEAATVTIDWDSPPPVE